MRVVIQRVSSASVKVNENVVGEIKQGLLLLVGFEPEDTIIDYGWIAKKVIHLRIFSDDQGVMNLSVKELNRDILVVSQFTLYASTKKGNRPSYIKASPPGLANQQYQSFLNELEMQFGKIVEKGIFGANMQVSLLNDGPVTILLDSKQKDI